jgi:hypothetical protein
MQDSRLGCPPERIDCKTIPPAYDYAYGNSREKRPYKAGDNFININLIISDKFK